MKQKLMIILSFMLLTTSVFATEKAPTLKSVMQGLADSMDILNKGIFYEDFKKIELGAKGIAVHPKPKSQLPTIIKTLNIRMLQFKGTDDKVHNAASSIRKLAKKKDMKGILKQHEIIMNNCVSCHTQFRDEIIEALK